MSFPTRERGLKYFFIAKYIIECIVVPHAGTWIEIELIDFSSMEKYGRSPRGNVD